MIIRRLTCFDYPKIKKLISYLSNDENDKFEGDISEEPLGFVNAMLPIKFKFKSESFVLIDNDDILGLITINYTQGNPLKVKITRLIFKENNYEIGKKLVEFVFQKIGAKGASTFVVMVDESHDELFDLFVNGCGFRQCSSETLWKIENPSVQKTSFRWRYAQNSDAKAISELFNSELTTIYKPSLLRTEKEFKPPFFAGFSEEYKNRYVSEECGKILGYFSITTSDNLNFICDITTNSGYEFEYGDIINKMLAEIKKRNKIFYPLIKQKKYHKNSERLENYLKSRNYLPIQTMHILVKDFYKEVPQEASDWKVFVFEENRVSN